MPTMTTSDTDAIFSVNALESAPVGAVVVEQGELAEENRIGFSTRYFELETGIGKWPRRDYLPATGRWASRDPVGERGGINLYAYANNEFVDHLDAVGEMAAGLTMQNLGITAGDCGNFTWRVSFSVSRPSRRRWGYVVQEAMQSWEYEWRGGVVSHQAWFTEFFRINARRDSPSPNRRGYTWSDTWLFEWPKGSNGSCTRGGGVYTGEAAYYHMLRLPGGARCGAVPEAGDQAPSIDGTVDLGAASSPSIQRQLSFSWDCFDGVIRKTEVRVEVMTPGGSVSFPLPEPDGNGG